MGGFAKERGRMVERHLKARDISDPKVLAAMGKVRREAFIPEQFQINAYADRPLPIGEGRPFPNPILSP